MTDNSQNAELLVESQEANTKITDKKEAVQDGMDAEDKAKEEVVKPAPKTIGRPAGVKDTKPRIKRVPAQQPPPPQQQDTAAKEDTPKSQEKKWKSDTRKSQKRSQKRSDSNKRKKNHSQKIQ